MLTEIALAAALLAARPTEAELHALTRATLELTILERDAIATQAQILLLQERLRDLVANAQAARSRQHDMTSELTRKYVLGTIRPKDGGRH